MTLVQYAGTLRDGGSVLPMSTFRVHDRFRTETHLPTRITRYRLTPGEVPVDFFADPDGAWDFASLVEMAGFNPETPGASVGALTEAFDGYPPGSAVVTEVGRECRFVAVAQLPNPERIGSQLTERRCSAASGTRAA